ncbi:hypothetical protein Cylst_5520 [Cylindrospermum stagnale PCC 7417]|uniref:Uncharacterized protein n=1 Tax=Cylindrospermum stagnale PCC 7417 TaxID=56107 RepID=K9X618_9NOST|nr:hypothetical protein [Cylindrospermum stagnale]AFZ27531.1 hypothetical protein Cylst_5520 [Cylindrospermum stagnale PCC 7417]
MLIQQQKVTKAKKTSLYFSLLGLSMSVFAAFPVSFFTSTTAAQAQNSENPTIATVASMTDIGGGRCSVTLVDEYQNQYTVDANSNVCAQVETFLNHKVSLMYEEEDAPDCLDAGPCENKITVITDMQLSDQ